MMFNLNGFVSCLSGYRGLLLPVVPTCVRSGTTPGEDTLGFSSVYCVHDFLSNLLMHSEFPRHDNAAAHGSFSLPLLDRDATTSRLNHHRSHLKKSPQAFRCRFLSPRPPVRSTLSPAFLQRTLSHRSQLMTESRPAAFLLDIPPR